jgi:hypothetical protein
VYCTVPRCPALWLVVAVQVFSARRLKKREKKKKFFFKKYSWKECSLWPFSSQQPSRTWMEKCNEAVKKKFFLSVCFSGFKSLCYWYRFLLLFYFCWYINVQFVYSNVDKVWMLYFFHVFVSLPFVMASYLAIQLVMTVSLLSPSMSGNVRIRWKISLGQYGVISRQCLVKLGSAENYHLVNTVSYSANVW